MIFETDTSDRTVMSEAFRSEYPGYEDVEISPDGIVRMTSHHSSMKFNPEHDQKIRSFVHPTQYIFDSDSQVGGVFLSNMNLVSSTRCLDICKSEFYGVRNIRATVIYVTKSKIEGSSITSDVIYINDGTEIIDSQIFTRSMSVSGRFEIKRSPVNTYRFIIDDWQRELTRMIFPANHPIREMVQQVNYVTSLADKPAYIKSTGLREAMVDFDPQEAFGLEAVGGLEYILHKIDHRMSFLYTREHKYVELNPDTIPCKGWRLLPVL